MTRRSRRSVQSRLVPTGFVLIRAARLPADAVLPIEPPADELAELVRASRDPIVAAAIAQASPDLDRALGRWRARPRDGRVSHALTRSLLRLGTRPTPFGHAATVSLGAIGERTRFRVGAAPTLRARLSPALLQAVVERAAREDRDAARLMLNPSAHFAAERLHLSGPEDWSALSIIEPTWLVTALVERGPRAGTLAEWRAWLVGLGLSSRVARAALRRLLAAELLLPEPIRLTDGDQTERVAAELGATALGRALRAVARSLRAAAGREPELARVRERARAIAEVTRPIDVDLLRPGRPTIARALLGDVARAILWLHRWNANDVVDPLADFRRTFLERYGDRRVPLVEVVDPEAGIGLALQGPEPGSRKPASRRDPRWQSLRRHLDRARAHASEEIELTFADLSSLDPPLRPLPRALAALGAVIAPVNDERARFFLENVHGPSGMELLGRPSAIDARIASGARRQLRAERDLISDAIVAEVVHLPEPRLGPILTRARLASHEIVGLGQGSVPKRRQLPLDDLLVSVSRESERTILESRRLGRRVEPRLTAAHRAIADPFLPYRLLGLLQREGVAHRLAWSWGPFAGRAALPRVRVGDVVLARRRWRVAPATLARWDGLGPTARSAAVARWRRRHRVPRWVAVLAAGDELIIDLERPLTVDASLSGRDPGALICEEMLPDRHQLAVTDGVDRYVHDVIVPFVDRAPAAPSVRRGRRAARAEPPGPAPVRTRSVPRSGYLSIKLYGGPAIADRILSELSDLVRSLDRSGALRSWFFLRYRDPDPHLRLRFEPTRGTGTRALADLVLPVVEDWCVRGLGYRAVVDRYRRERARWGGPKKLAAVERWFRADSDAVLAVLAGDRTDDREQRLAIGARGTDDLLDGLGLDLAARLGTVVALRSRRLFEHSVDGEIKREAGALFRIQREPTVSPEATPPLEERRRAATSLTSALGFSRRSRLGPAALVRAGDLTHLWLNRVQSGGDLAAEAICLEWLARAYRSRLARGR